MAPLVAAALVIPAIWVADAEAKSSPKPSSSSTPGCPESHPTYTGVCGPTYTLPQWSDLGGWDRPSSYSTIQLAQLEGHREDDLIGRDANGIWVEQFNPSSRQWELQASPEGGLALNLTNAKGWTQPQYYETIQTADVTGSGQSDLLARGAAGLHTWHWNATSDKFVEVGRVLGALSDGAGFNQPQYYKTIQTADVRGDGQEELLARSRDGLHTYEWEEDGWKQIGPALTALSDSAGFNQPQYYNTIKTADVLGDGREELLARSRDGLHTFKWGQHGWVQIGNVLDLTDAQHWNQPQYYETIQTADLLGNGKVELLARGSTGLHTYRWSSDGWSAAGPVLPLSDNAGWNKPQYYKTIQTADLAGNEKAELLARGGKGIAVYQWKGPTGGWSELSDHALALADPLWEKPQYYETIHTGDITGDGQAELIARGPYGIRTFRWDPAKRAFVRPLPYGDFPRFSGAQQDAYRALGRFLLGRPVDDFRKETYATPSNSITEATLDRYRSLLAERCEPVVFGSGGGPPRYTDCKPPPGSGVDPGAWTVVSNHIIDELWAAAGATGYFSTLETIELKLFQDQQGVLPALDAVLKVPPNPPERSASYLKLVKAGLEIAGDVFQFFPIAKEYPRVVRSIALLAHTLGAIGEALGLRDTASPASTWAAITQHVAHLQQRERDITEANRRYVLADYGLLMTVGSLTNGRVLTLDSAAMLSAGRQSFARWVYQLYIPAYWQRYNVIFCKNAFLVSCKVPSGVTVRRGGKSGDSSFTAVLHKDSKCVDSFGTECTWHLPGGQLGILIWGHTDPSCEYNPAPGSSAAWRYGCSLGVNPNDLIDNRSGWNFHTVYCDVRYLAACAGHRP
jgi:hypothetical protein